MLNTNLVEDIIRYSSINILEMWIHVYRSMSTMNVWDISMLSCTNLKVMNSW